jgi:hypothetical protein
MAKSSSGARGIDTVSPFGGFGGAGYTQAPNELFDQLLPTLSL